MEQEELKVLLDAASLARIPATDLKPVNPWSQTGPRAETMRMAVSQLHPAQAARWRIAAGETISLASAAAKLGLAEMDAGTQKELAELDPDFVVKQQQDKESWEAKMLDQMTEEAGKLGEAREKQTQAFARQAGNSSNGSHTRDFYRRLGITDPKQLGNIPARRLLNQ